MKTRTETTGEVNWSKVSRFIKKVLPRLESKVSSAFSGLETLEPSLIEGYSPTSIHLRFVKKGKSNLDTEKGNLNDEDLRVLRENQSYISETLGEIAEEYNLEVVKGIRTRDYWGCSVSLPGIGLYTLKPKYSEFVK